MSNCASTSEDRHHLQGGGRNGGWRQSVWVKLILVASTSDHETTAWESQGEVVETQDPWAEKAPEGSAFRGEIFLTAELSQGEVNSLLMREMIDFYDLEGYPSKRKRKKLVLNVI